MATPCGPSGTIFTFSSFRSSVDVEAVGDGRAVLKYLAPYVHRVAISNNRIESVDDTHVKYRYTPTGSQRSRRRRVTGQEFVRGFLQHTLPPNFQRIRYYGFLSPNSSLSLDRVRMLVWFYLGWCYVLARRNRPEPQSRPPVLCGECGGEMRLNRAVEMTVVQSCAQPVRDKSARHGAHRIVTVISTAVGRDHRFVRPGHLSRRSVARPACGL